jgi:uncharacterized membrane protein
MFAFVGAVLFAIFIANVVIGAFGGTQFLDDVKEMLVLFASSLAFVVLILQREAAATSETNKTNEPKGGQNGS